MAGIGHNSGRSKRGLGWQKHCWTVARRELLGKAVPVEVVRMRIKWARQLGLAYPEYASILRGSGQDIVGFLFTVEGLQLRLQRQLEMPEGVKGKLQGLQRCDLLAFSPSGEIPKVFRAELNDVSGVDFAAAAPEPEQQASWPEARKAVRAVLDPLNLPSGAVVMIGGRGVEEPLAMAGKLARYIRSDDYFGQAAGQWGLTGD